MQIIIKNWELEKKYRSAEFGSLSQFRGYTIDWISG